MSGAEKFPTIRSMKRILSCAIAAFALMSAARAGGEAANPPPAELRLDASDAKKMQDSFMKMLSSLDGATQQKFAAAMATIGVYYMQNAGRGGNAEMGKAIDGKTADEIIALSRRLFPGIKQNTKIIDGSSRDSFGRSIAEILVSLPPEKQTAFSEAVAKVMYDNQKAEKKEEETMKRLDGKTADEVIELATGISTPFDNPSISTPKNYTLREMTKEEIGRLKRPDAGKTLPDYESNLSPSSIIKK